MQLPRTFRRLAVVGAAGLVATLLPTAAGADHLPPACADGAPAADFDDREAISDTHRAAVDCLADLGVVEGRGYDEGVRYLPGAEVRRDQMATFVVAALETIEGNTVPEPEDQGFEDVEGTYHADRIRQVAEMGIAEGTTATTYAPGEPVTRQQMASFLLRATAWSRDTTVDALAGGPTPFDDIAGSTHETRIAGAYHLGITAGVDADSYAPGAPVTREQMASFVVAALGAMSGDADTCTNHRDGYALTMPSDWHTNAGHVEPRCTAFDDARFVLERGTEIPGDLAVRVITTSERDYEAAADAATDAGTRTELERRTDDAGGHDAIVVEAEATGEGLYPEGTMIYTWYVDISVDGETRTLIANTMDLADDYAGNQAALDTMMDTLVVS